MQNDRSKFKDEFKGRVYRFALDIIGFVERLPKGQVSRIISDQLLRSATSIGANVVEAQGAGSRKDYTNFLMRLSSGWVFCGIRVKLKGRPPIDF